MELRNPLSKYQLDVLRPRPLVVDFDWSDVSGGNLLMGICPAGHLIDKTVIDVSVPFDGSLQITVGDSVAQGRLQAASDNVPDEVGRYEARNDYEYALDTEIFLFFPSGIPTIGSGRAIVYFD
jgi:hypothetical protein